MAKTSWNLKKGKSAVQGKVAKSMNEMRIETSTDG